jgi:hypothetical protein
MMATFFFFLAVCYNPLVAADIILVKLNGKIVGSFNIIDAHNKVDIVDWYGYSAVSAGTPTDANG